MAAASIGQQLLNNNQIRGDDERHDHLDRRAQFDHIAKLRPRRYSGHGLGLGAYSSWIVFV